MKEKIWKINDYLHDGNVIIYDRMFMLISCIALSFERLDEGIRIAIQSEHTGGSTKYDSERNEDLNEIGSYTTSILSEKTEFVYEEEIPLAVQIITSKNEVVSYQVDYFHSPEEYEKLGYEGVFAITVRFSQKTVAELDMQ